MRRLARSLRPAVPRALHARVRALGRADLRKHGVKTLDVAKRLLDFGVHAPTVYFPLIVEEALMIEPTETETLDRLDHFADAMVRIAGEARDDPRELLTTRRSPRRSRRLDEGARGARAQARAGQAPSRGRAAAPRGSRPRRHERRRDRERSRRGADASAAARSSGRSTRGASALGARPPPRAGARLCLLVLAWRDPSCSRLRALRSPRSRRCRRRSRRSRAAWTMIGVARRGPLGWERRRWSDLRRAALRRARAAASRRIARATGSTTTRGSFLPLPSIVGARRCASPRSSAHAGTRHGL